MIKFLINKPIAVLMTTLAVVILGLVASGNIPISLMPEIAIPEITVRLSGEDMSARQLEDAVVKRLRNQLMQVGHLEDMRSETTDGHASIRLRFAHGSDINYAFIEVNEKIDRAMAGLPRDMERPQVIKASASDLPVFYLDLTLDKEPATKANGNLTREFIDFSRLVDRVIRKRIEQLPDVAMVDMNGRVSTEIVVSPNHDRLTELGIGLADLEVAITRQNIEIGSILVRDSQYQYNLRLGANLRNIKDIEEVYLNVDGRLFQLKNLASVSERAQKRTGLSLYNNKEAISLAIIKQGEARMGDLKKALHATVARMENDYPEIRFSILRDQTRLLDYAMGNLGQSLLWGIGLAFLVMFVFLKDFKAPILIGISVPLSIVVSLLFFFLLKISINIISLSGLILGTGLMIDNAIIVIDNITQYRQQGYPLSRACVEATNEVTRPMLSAVLTTCAVFVPLIFLGGTAGVLFYDQAMAISIGLFVSLLVSITVLPVIFRLFHKNEKHVKGSSRLLGRVNGLDYARLYEKGFRFTFKRQGVTLAVFIFFILLTVVLYWELPKSQMPELTTTETLMEIDWNEPLNVRESKERVLELLSGVHDDLKQYDAQIGQQQFLRDIANNGTAQAGIYIQALSASHLKKVQGKLRQLQEKHYPGAVVTYTAVDNIFNLIFSDNQTNLTARLMRVNSIVDTDERQLQGILDSLNKAWPGIVLQPIAWSDHLELRADVEKMRLYGVSSGQLETAIRSALGEKEVLSITDNQDFVPVVLGDEPKALGQILDETWIRTNDTTAYKLGAFLREQKSQSLKKITAGKEGEYFPVDLTVQGDEGSVIKMVKEVVKGIPSYDVVFDGGYLKDRELIKELILVLSITLALLYFILASQFESLTLPFIILLEVPISMAGALLLLGGFGMGLNLMSMIGIVVMCGIIINDSILKLDTVIQLQKQGHGIFRALLIAGQRRLKPILMTSLTTILALLPVLLTGGLGSELQAPLAVALIGGMLLGTLVSLYLVPLLYYYLTKNKTSNAGKRFL